MKSTAMKLSFIGATLLTATTSALAGGPSFSCEGVKEGSIEALICENKTLSSLDRIMGNVYKQAKEKAGDGMIKELKAMQRGWIKGRNDCWKSDDKMSCVAESYQNRMVTLQAKYRLVDADGPHYLGCDGDARNEVVVTHFDTAPASLIAERGDASSLMIQQESGEYKGRNESMVKNPAGKYIVVWGYETPEMDCEVKPQ